jgi:hypothetical protein
MERGAARRRSLAACSTSEENGAVCPERVRLEAGMLQEALYFLGFEETQAAL